MPVRDDELVPDFNFNDLFTAYYDCRKRKRNTHSALKFELQLEKNMLELYRDLKTGRYKIGKYICFIVTEPKTREVWAANFRDRIVHHLVYNAVKDRFYNRFICDSYSCIPKKGTLAGAFKMLHYTRSSTNNYTKKMYYLKADLSNFFVSIDKKILYEIICGKVSEKWILKLFRKIIFHDPRTNVYIKSRKELFDRLPSYKSLWGFEESDHGLPIGNLTSQFFSNVYLDVLDQYIKRELHCKYYCRYVDDFVIIGETPKELARKLKLIQKFLKENLKIELNTKKCYINQVSKGIDFVGYFIKPNRILARKKNINKMYKTMRRWKHSPNRFEKEPLEEFLGSINSYLGMLRHTNNYEVRKDICLKFNSLFIRGENDFSKAKIHGY